MTKYTNTREPGEFGDGVTVETDPISNERLVGVSREALNEVILAFGREQRRASVVTPEMVEQFIVAASTAGGSTEDCVRAGLTAALSVSHETSSGSTLIANMTDEEFERDRSGENPNAGKPAPTDETQGVKRDKWEERFWKMDANFDRAQTRADAAEQQVQKLTADKESALSLLNHLIAWIVHDCGAEVPFTDEQDAAFAVLETQEGGK